MQQYQGYIKIQQQLILPCAAGEDDAFCSVECLCSCVVSMLGESTCGKNVLN